MLIKSIAQAILVYDMNCFLLPMGLCDDINSMMGQFWWGQKNEEKKLHWLIWKQLCLAKKDGGLGFQDLKCFNLALLAKQCWRLQHNQDSLFYKVYKAKYFPNTSFLEVVVPNHSLYAWRSITQGRHLIIQGSQWRVGDGSLINIWADKWLPSETNQKVLSPRTILPPKARVADLMDFSSPQPRWKNILIDTIFYPFEASIIKAIPLSFRRPNDSLIWTRNKSGEFSVRGAYYLQTEIERNTKGNQASSSNPSRLHSFWIGIWAAQVPPKIKTFIWRTCHDNLPTRTKLFDGKILNSFSCMFCTDEAETCNHLFLECPFAQAVWLQSPISNDYRFPSNTKFIDVMDAAPKKLPAIVFETLCIACWMIWKCRNKLVFDNIASSHKDL